MSTIGTLSPYQDKEDFVTYIDRVEFFFAAIALISDAEKVPTFLSAVVPEVYGLGQNLVSPKKNKRKYI